MGDMRIAVDETHDRRLRMACVLIFHLFLLLPPSKAVIGKRWAAGPRKTPDASATKASRWTQPTQTANASAANASRRSECERHQALTAIVSHQKGPYRLAQGPPHVLQGLAKPPTITNLDSSPTAPLPARDRSLDTRTQEQKYTQTSPPPERPREGENTPARNRARKARGQGNGIATDTRPRRPTKGHKFNTPRKRPRAQPGRAPSHTQGGGPVSRNQPRPPHGAPHTGNPEPPPRQRSPEAPRRRPNTARPQANPPKEAAIEASKYDPQPQEQPREQGETTRLTKPHAPLKRQPHRRALTECAPPSRAQPRS